MKKNTNQISLFECKQIKNCSLGPKSNYSDYNTYIRSPEWKAKREKAFQILGRKCQRCGNIKKLEVHHLNYDNLFNESVSDVEIVCNNCHPVEDDKRATKKGYETWLRNRHGEWANHYDDEFEYEKFMDWKFRD